MAPQKPSAGERQVKPNPAKAFAPAATPTVSPAGSIPDGKRADYLAGNLVNDTPEEYVRQNIEKALVRQGKSAAQDFAPEFPIKVGSSRKRVDIVVFPEGVSHTQAGPRILIETKRPEVKANHRAEGIGQLQSYMGWMLATFSEAPGPSVRPSRRSPARACDASPTSA